LLRRPARGAAIAVRALAPGEIMKAICARASAFLLAAFAGAGGAQAVNTGSVVSLEPSLSVVWLIVFLAIFFVICVWIAVAIWRTERKNRTHSQENARP
jgi:hypothetical protein